MTLTEKERGMPEPVMAIRNIGPEMAAAFARVGISTAEELRELGADAAYARLLAAGRRPHFIGFYALAMGLQGRPWNDCRGSEKEELRRRFDALKTGVAETGPELGRARLEAELDALGVISRDRKRAAASESA